MMEFTPFAKICAKCGIKFYPHFSKHNTQKYCSSTCRYSQWSSENREKLNAHVRAYRSRRYVQEGRWRDEGVKAKTLKEWMITLKSQPCMDCGGMFPTCCMDFDHKHGEKKQYNVGSMFAHHYSRELIEKELKKCDLVCSNCHRIRTRERRIGNGKYKVAS